jgi:hypothetical protein
MAEVYACMMEVRTDSVLWSNMQWIGMIDENGSSFFHVDIDELIRSIAYLLRLHFGMVIETKLLPQEVHINSPFQQQVYKEEEEVRSEDEGQ